MNTWINWIRPLCCSRRHPNALRLLIVFKNKKSHKECVHCLKKLGIRPAKSIKGSKAVCCYVNKNSAWRKLIKHPMIKRVEPDYKVKQHKIEIKAFKNGVSKMAFKKSNARTIPWGIQKVGAPSVWNTVQGSGVGLAVIDTGIANHMDLNIAGSYNAVGSGPATDQNGHGTHVSGTIAALRNGYGVTGMAPKVNLYGVKALDRSGSGYVSDIIEAIDWCIDHGIRVINMSFGTSQLSRSMHDAIKRAHAKGIILVASAGNSGKKARALDYPARFPEVIAVAASAINNKIASFSSRGSGITVTAPGVKIISTWLNNKYRELNGTSMASPHVAGAAALLLTKRPQLNAVKVSSILRKSARRLKGFGQRDQGAGMLNMVGAIRLA